MTAIPNTHNDAIAKLIPASVAAKRQAG